MYTERPSRLPGAVVWQRSVPPGGSRHRVLPDGCLDLIWADGDLFVAGPDTVTEVATARAGARYAALRFAPGVGPGVLGVPAHELRDRRVPLADLWPAGAVRCLAEQMAAAADPAGVLERAVAPRWAPPDPVLAGVVTGARAGRPVAALAAAAGLSSRQLHRRSVVAFGYGPKTLVRILRLQRAVTLAAKGRPFAEVAALTGYADQAHLARDVRALAGVPLGELVR